MAPPVRTRGGGRSGTAQADPELVLAGRAWIGGRLQPVEIGLDDEGRILTLGRDRSGAHRHDVGDRVIVPAATDLHVHFREPGPADAAESIASGTVGAALGGVGLVGEMPNTEPPVTSLERLEEKADRVRGRAAVDVLLYACPRTPRSVRSLAAKAGGFKVFLSPTTNIEPVGPGTALPELLAALAEVDLPVAVHAEDPAFFRPGPRPTDPVGWDRVRPAEAEERAIERLTRAPERLRLHVAHVTTPDVAASLVARRVSFEATPHHLLLAAQGGADARFKVNPPLRARGAQEGLWTMFREGRIPCVASDHAPHPVEAKARPFEVAPSGVPGVETMLPLLLARVGSGDLALSIVLASLCDRPARVLGQPVGRLAVGHRANLLVIDFRDRRPVRGDRLRSPCGWSPFEGSEAVFPTEHWRDGERIVDDGEYVGRPNGRVVRPEFARPSVSAPLSPA